MSQYRVKGYDKTVGKERVTVKSENQIYKEDKCKLCDQMFKAKCGLNIHVRKIHGDTVLAEDKKRKFSNEKIYHQFAK